MNEYQIETNKMGKNKIILLIVALVVAALAVGLIYYFTKLNQPLSKTGGNTTVTIAKGTSTHTIASELSQDKIISSEWIFVIYTRLTGAADKIEAGDYDLNATMSITEIVDILTHGRVLSSVRNFTTIEGWTNLQIASYLTDRQLVPNTQSFADTLQKTQFDFQYNDVAKQFNYQGFLFPDTYEINKDQGADALAQKMLTNFQNKITPQMLSDIQSSGRNLADVIILASIIEKEVGRNKANLTQADLNQEQLERTEVASVFYNRLQIGMPLESDATVNYVTGKSDPSVSLQDTKISSPYNTYQVKGLPPGPISNPGLGSIMAAIYPANTDYLYFLNAPDGTAYFAKTLAEQTSNKAKYLK